MVQKVKLYNSIKNLLITHSHVNWAIADQAVVSGSNLLTGILLARILGLAGFGVFTLVSLIVLFVLMVQHTAIIAPMMSIAPKQPQEDKSGYFGAIFIQLLAFIAICSIITFFGIKIADWVNVELNLSALAFPLTLTVAVSLFQTFLRRYFFTIGKPFLSFFSDVFSYISQILLLMYIFFFKPFTLNVESALWMMSGTTILGIIVVLTNLPELAFSKGKFKIYCLRHWNFSKWLTASTLIKWFTDNIFTIVAGTTLGAAPVGALKAAQTLLGVTHVIFLALENIVPIKASELLTKYGPQRMVNYLFHGGVIGVIFAIAISMIFAIFPEFWIRLIYGDQYVPYSYLVKWIAGFYTLMIITMQISYGLRTLEVSKVFFYAYLLIAILSIISVTFVIDTFGIVGVPIASIITQTIMIVIMFYYFRKYISRITQ